MENEYLARVRALDPRVEPDGLPDWRWRIGSVEVYLARRRLTVEFAWAIPNEAALETLAQHAPLVEIGAGTGYWAALLRARGVDILAYDPKPGRNHFAERLHTHVVTGTHRMVRKHPDRTLFLCWPSYDDNFAANALRAYQGETVIYVGEGPGGCCASEAFFTVLKRRWVTQTEVAIPQWPGLNDALWVYRRRPYRRRK